MRKFLLACFWVLFSASITSGVLAQGTHVPFGQNRVQHERFKWYSISTQHFNGYYYGEGVELTKFALKRAEVVLSDVEKFLGYRLGGSMNIVLYNSLDDYKQSNIGLEDQQFNSGGYTRIVGDNIVAYFNGDYIELQRQLKSGIAKVLLNEMMYGGSIQERIQNATLMNIPVWFSEGLVSYVAQDWSVEMDDRMKDAIKWNKMKRFNDLSEEEQIFAGHSIWKFIVDVEGDNTVANILYVVRLTRNFEDGLMFVLGDNFNQIYSEWISYYTSLYSQDDDNRYLPERPEDIDKAVSKMKWSNLRIDSDGKKLAFVTDDRGRREVRVHTMSSNQTESIFKLGFKSHDISEPNDYPIINWLPDGNKLGIVYAQQGKTVLRVKSIGSGKHKDYDLAELDQVVDISFSNSGDQAIIAGLKDGKADLFIYYLKTKVLERLTNDEYTEYQPTFNSLDNAVLYAANYEGQDSTRSLSLSTTTDIFIINIETKKVTRLTNTPNVSEKYPVEYTDVYYSFLADNNGIFNSYVIPKSGYDTIAPMPLTNYKRSILSQNMSVTGGVVAEMLFFEDQYRVYVSEVSSDIVSYSSELNLLPTAYIKSLNDSTFIKGVILEKEEPQQKIDEEDEDDLKDENEDEDKPTIKVRKSPQDTLTDEHGVGEDLANDGITLQNPYPDDLPKTKDDEKEEKKVDQSLAATEGRPYRLAFTPTYFVAQLDNSIVNTYYAPFDAGRNLFSSRIVTGSTQVGLSDLMNDYRIDMGYRMAGIFSGSDYWVSFTAAKGRMEKTFSYFRKSRFDDKVARFERVTINEGAFGVRYPFNNRSSISADVFYREDNIITLTSDRNTLLVPDNKNAWLGFRARYVFDNTISTGLNLYNGLKFALFAESYNATTGKYGDLLNLGADFRHYLKVDRQIIWANRFSINTSTGPTKVLYYLGGVENWLDPRFNGDLAVINPEQYAFSSLSTNLRGFRQNVRNGNSIAAINSELRVPIVQYLSEKPVKSEFAKHLAFVPFVDVGTAWVGSSPYSTENPFNTRTIDNPNLTITVVSQGNPFVVGYGVGVRTRILGYYLRYDMAWGKQQGIPAERMSYLSLGVDF